MKGEDARSRVKEEKKKEGIRRMRNVRRGKDGNGRGMGVGSRQL